MDPGHIFVTRADITFLGCDFWLLPTGCSNNSCDFDNTWINHWLKAKKYNSMSDVPIDEQPDSIKYSFCTQWNFGEDYSLIFTYSHSNNIKENVEKIKNSLQEICDLSIQNKLRKVRFGRERPFIGVPIDKNIPQEIIKEILTILLKIAESAPYFDIILVASDEVI